MIVALSQNSNRNLKSLSTMTKSIKGFRQQIENEMQALIDQGLRRLDRIKEMLIVRENVQEMTLKYT
jgi:BMFP domain-containing protein YqiC